MVFDFTKAVTVHYTIYHDKNEPWIHILNDILDWLDLHNETYTYLFERYVDQYRGDTVGRIYVFDLPTEKMAVMFKLKFGSSNKETNARA